MRKMSFLKKIWKFLVDNYFISIFIACIGFVAVVSVYKLFFVKPTYVYAKVKVGQGLWWASTQKPSSWYIEAFQNVIKTKESENDLSGNLQSQILSMRYYPTYIQNQYDVYLIMKLKVSKLGKTGKYNFKRSSIGVSSPVDFEFPSVQFSGTIIDISEKSIKDKLVEKEIVLAKRNSDPWEYEVIEIGDYYFDGKEKVFEIIDKSARDTYVLTSETFRSYPIAEPELRKYIFVKAKIKVKQEGVKLIFGEEQILSVGQSINIVTNKFVFQNYRVAEIKPTK